uniref:Glyoxylate reductase/hydroxypyruvate reductase n=1 Tax=Lygus hesperus TaxID=30085 RepID=A0A146LKS7_LYGHE
MTKPKVFMTRNDWPKECIDLLQNDQFELEMWDTGKSKEITKNDLLKKVVGVSGIFCSPSIRIDKEVIEAAGPSLKVVGTFSVGVDHIDLATLKAKGIRLGYTPGVLTEATAELTVALLLATSRRLFEANQAIRDGEWTSAWAPLQWCGPALQGSTVGVYGFGRIGQSVARKLKAFEVSRILYSSSAEKPEGKEMGAECTSFETLLRESDFLIVTCALTDQTRGLFNKEKFAMMKPTAIFVNSSRGGVVDQEALQEALLTGKIRGAGLDVMTPEPLPKDHPLLSIKNCVIVPHLGSTTIETRVQMGVTTSKNIIAALTGGNMPAEYPL